MVVLIASPAAFSTPELDLHLLSLLSLSACACVKGALTVSVLFNMLARFASLKSVSSSFAVSSAKKTAVKAPVKGTFLGNDARNFFHLPSTLHQSLAPL